jgi:hypothetical protein
MNTFKIIPILGQKTCVSQADMSLFRFGDDPNVAFTYCVDSQNVDYDIVRNSVSKSFGKTIWSNSAAATTQNCLGMFELFDGTNRSHWVFMGDGAGKGRAFRYDSSRDPALIQDAGTTELADDIDSLYTAIRVGAYMVFTDYGEHTPYKADYNDATLTKLIDPSGASGYTEYKFRYLETFQRRIIGAYSDQTNGSFEIRWTDALPDLSSDVEFPAANQLYMPGDDPIAGIKRLGNNACLLYGQNSINRIDYYANYAAPFGIINTVAGQGAVNHHSIIAKGNTQYFFNKNYGFCATNGTSEFPLGGKPISDDIETLVEAINSNYYNRIVGSDISNTPTIVWTVPAEGSSTPNKLYFYDTQTGNWSIQDKAMRFINAWQVSSNVTWTQLAALYVTWQLMINAGLRWGDLFTSGNRIVFSNTDGHTYYLSGYSDNTANYDSYRTEPAINFGGNNFKSLLLEIEFALSKVGNYNIYCRYRGADSPGEIENASWELLPSVNCNSPSNAITRLAKLNKYHQIKWGTSGANENFSINGITFKYSQEGQY